MEDKKPEEPSQQNEFPLSPFDSKSFSSCHINFLFGSGVNGDLIPQMKGLSKTQEFLRNALKIDEDIEIEEGMTRLANEADKTKCENIFRDELKEKMVFDQKKTAFQDIKHLLAATRDLVSYFENRTPSTKQINIFTLNYDDVVETAAEQTGIFCNVISPSTIERKKQFENVVCYRYDQQKFVPAILVQKIHGCIDDMVFPGSDKFRSGLAKSHFEMLFDMKGKLARRNSILIVIGYSGRDEDINSIVEAGIESGLTVYWFKYCSADSIPDRLTVSTIENEGGGNTTALCASYLKNLCQF